MTKREWKVGERCWVVDQGVRHGEVVRVSAPYVNVRTDIGTWEHAVRCVYTTRDAARLAKARDALDSARDDERFVQKRTKAARTEVRRWEACAARCAVAREKAEKRLAALRAKVKP